MNEEDGDPISIATALEVLTEEWNGDNYKKPASAVPLVEAFRPHLEDALPDDHDAMQSGSLWANRYVANVSMLAKDARGVPTVPQFESLLLVADLSKQLADDLGVSVGTSNAAGNARAKREAHEATMLNIGDHLTGVDTTA